MLCEYPEFKMMPGHLFIAEGYKHSKRNCQACLHERSVSSSCFLIRKLNVDIFTLIIISSTFKNGSTAAKLLGYPTEVPQIWEFSICQIGTCDVFLGNKISSATRRA